MVNCFTLILATSLAVILNRCLLQWNWVKRWLKDLVGMILSTISSLEGKNYFFVHWLNGIGRKIFSRSSLMKKKAVTYLNSKEMPSWLNTFWTISKCWRIILWSNRALLITTFNVEEGNFGGITLPDLDGVPWCNSIPEIK